MSYYEKYLKYKNKYLDLKFGGMKRERDPIYEVPRNRHRITGIFKYLNKESENYNYISTLPPESKFNFLNSKSSITINDQFTPELLVNIFYLDINGERVLPQYGNLTQIIIENPLFDSLPELQQIIHHAPNLVDLQLRYDTDIIDENSLMSMDFSTLPNLSSLHIVNYEARRGRPNIESIANLRNLQQLSLIYFNCGEDANIFIKIVLNNPNLMMINLPERNRHSYNNYLLRFIHFLCPSCTIEPKGLPWVWRDIEEYEGNPMILAYNEQPFLSLTENDIPDPQQFARYETARTAYLKFWSSIYF
jgi:hypothetical protein